METTTYQEIQGLARMTVGELQEKYLDVFGEETRSYHKEFLRKRIAWRIQVLAIYQLYFEHKAMIPVVEELGGVPRQAMDHPKRQRARRETL